MMPFEAIDNWVTSNIILTLGLLTVALIICIIWGMWGNIIFKPWKWSRYEEYEYIEYTPSQEIVERIMPKPEPEVEKITLKGEFKKGKRKKIKMENIEDNEV